MPLATAIIDGIENAMMLSLLRNPNQPDLAERVVLVSALKWQALCATASVVAGTGMYCITKGKRMAVDGGGGGGGATATGGARAKRA